MERDRFEQLAREALENLPHEFAHKMENVVIVVEDTPSESQKKGRGLLLGLYEGVPLNRRGAHYGAYPVAPDKISLFQKNIERVSRDDREVTEKIKEVLIHEIAHHFGMDEQEIRDAGY
jgi:predicted Zn-dependent protease with MMP-like domain